MGQALDPSEQGALGGRRGQKALQLHHTVWTAVRASLPGFGWWLGADVWFRLTMVAEAVGTLSADREMTPILRRRWF